MVPAKKGSTEFVEEKTIRTTDQGLYIEKSRFAHFVIHDSLKGAEQHKNS